MEIDVFPNPTNRDITIKLGGKHNLIDFIELINSMGQSVLLKRDLPDLVSINLENFETGLYFLRIKKGNSFITKKLIVR